MSRIYRLLKSHRYEITMVTTIVCLSVSVYLFFKTFFDSNPNNVTSEVLAALLGAIVTVMITMLLLRQQGKAEQVIEETAASKTKVFEKKLELFQGFIHLYATCAVDGKLTNAELAELKTSALTISLFTKRVHSGKNFGAPHDLGEVLCRFVLQLEIFGLNQHQEILKNKNFTSEQSKMYAKHFGGCGFDDYLSLAYIIEVMKARLAIEKIDTDDFDDHQIIPVSQKWAYKLLEVRDNPVGDQ